MASRARTWTCRKCGLKHAGLTQRCPCGVKRPPRRIPKNQMILELMPYEQWVERFGERCAICGRPPGPNRRLDRDHDHRTGEPRGLLCHLCNRRLGSGVDVAWLWKALHYLQTHSDRTEQTREVA